MREGTHVVADVCVLTQKNFPKKIEKFLKNFSKKIKKKII